jgi:2-methylcitrate dehydratase PrpD
LRARVNASVDDTIHEDAAVVTALLKDGRRVEVRVEHAIGSMRKPLTDAQLEAKFDALVTPVLGAERSREITGQWRGLAVLADVRAMVALCRP